MILQYLPLQTPMRKRQRIVADEAAYRARIQCHQKMRVAFALHLRHQANFVLHFAYVPVDLSSLCDGLVVVGYWRIINIGFHVYSNSLQINAMCCKTLSSIAFNLDVNMH